MEVFVFLEDEVSQHHCFSISPGEGDTKVVTIIEKFAEIVKATIPDFDYTKFNVYVNDFSNPTSETIIGVVKDINIPISAIDSLHFDLILSHKTPEVVEFQKHEYQMPAEEETKFEELIQQGRIYYEIKDYNSAWQIFQTAAAINKNSPIPIHHQLKILLKTKRYKSAMALASSTINKFPDDRTSQELFAHAHQLSGSHTEAICHYRRLLLLPPHTQAITDHVNCCIAKSLIAIGSLDQAMSLLQPIATNNPTNLKALALMSQTLYKQGRLPDALVLIIQNFSLDPFHKKSREFIGNAIINEDHAALLKSLLGDSAHDPKALFVIGNILDSHGSCDIARGFIKEAGELLPDDPAIAVASLLNASRTSQTFIQVLDAAMPFILRLKQRDDIFARIIDGIDFLHPIDAFSSEYTPPPVAQPVVFKDEKQSYSIKEIDVLYFLIELESLFYANGFISTAKQIADSLIPLMQPFAFNETILSEPAALFGLVSSLSFSLARPIPKKEPIFIIGDSHCLPLAWRVACDKLTTPIFIDGISVESIAEGARTPFKFVFDRAIERLPTGAPVVLILGYGDCAERIHSKISKLEFDSFQEAFLGPCAHLVSAAAKIAEKKNSTVYLHPVVPVGFETAGYARIFNDLLASKAKAEKNVKYLDFFDEIIEKKENGDEVLKAEYAYDEYHMSPKYLPIFEKALSAAMALE